jgi:hypothetical protein
MDLPIAATIAFTVIPTLVLVGLFFAMSRGGKAKP